MGDRYMRGHIVDAQIENVEFLVEVAGLNREQAAKRVGLTLDAVDKIMERRKGAVDGVANPAS